MKFLGAVAPEFSNDTTTKAGEPVIPWYPAPPVNVFLGTVTFRQATHAVVIDDPELDVDDILRRLCKQYPGLPEKLHANYIYHVARAAREFPVGTRFRIYISDDTARLHEISGSERLFTLWEHQPLEV